MGLTVHYSLKAQGTDDHARKLVQALHQTAQALPFKELGPVVELSGAQCDPDRRPREDPVRWLLIQATEHVESKNRRVAVQPTRLFAFTAWPGEGCEASNFGLGRFPAVVETERGPIETRLSGWYWGSFCKTQYSSNPACGGALNFLRCHLSIVALLDRAQELGCLAEVSDESKFWEKRDLKALVEEINSWNEMVSADGSRTWSATISTWPSRSSRTSSDWKRPASSNSPSCSCKSAIRGDSGGPGGGSAHRPRIMEGGKTHDGE